MEIDKDVLVVLIITLSAFTCVYHEHFLRSKRSSRRWWVRPLNRNRHRQGFHLTLFRELKCTDHEEFFAYTKMWPHQFNDLLRRVHPFLPTGGPRQPLHSELKLALTLAFLAHGDSARSKAWEFRIGRSTVYKVIKEVCQALWVSLQPDFLPPPCCKMWSEVADGFFTQWQFPNCIGALDGKHIKIKAPPSSGSKYFCYKKYFSTVLMAICDANYKFIWVDIGQYGSVSDGGVWANTDLASSFDLDEMDLPPSRELPLSTVKTNCAFVADEAFPLGMHMLRPYSRKSLENNDNCRLSRARRTIENAFGIMAARWQILVKGLSFHPNTVDDIIKAIVCLHNFIMSDETKFPSQQRRYCAPRLVDQENSEHELMEGLWRGHADHSPLFTHLQRFQGNSGTDAAKPKSCSYEPPHSIFNPVDPQHILYIYTTKV